jgi:hypothetical protein
MKNLAATPEVIEIGKINFSGNILPESWFQELQHNGKTNINAVVILSEIVWWYRPIEVRDEETGRIVKLARKFKGSILQRSYQSLAQKFGISKKQVADACKFLQKLGLIDLLVEKIFITTTGDRLGNVLFIKIHPKRINEITHPLLPESNSPPLLPESNSSIPESNSSIPESNSCYLEGGSYAPGSNTNTEITTEITTERFKDPPLPPKGGKGVSENFQEPNSQTAVQSTATIAPTQNPSTEQPQPSNGRGQYSAARREPKSIRNVRRHYGATLPIWRVGWGKGEYTPEILNYTQQYIANLSTTNAIAHYTAIQLLEEYEEKERWANLESRAQNLANGHTNGNGNSHHPQQVLHCEIECPNNAESYQLNPVMDVSEQRAAVQNHWNRLHLNPSDDRWINWLSRVAPDLDPASGYNDRPEWLLCKLAHDLEKTLC